MTSPSRQKPWVAPVIAALAALVVLLAVAATWFALRSRPVDAAAPPSSPPVSTFTLNGTVSLLRSSAVLNQDDVHCIGMLTYDDIHDGTQVTVTDQDGTILGVGKVQRGDLRGGGPYRTCTMPFSVTGIPGGKAFYAVEVAHRGRNVYPAADMAKRIDVVFD